ncbi:MAG: YybH family protein [Gemmatimonadota bacterium]
MPLHSFPTRRPAFALVPPLLALAALLCTLGARPSAAQERERVLRYLPGSWQLSAGREMNGRLERWRRAWSRKAVKRLVSMYTDDAMLIPPGEAPVARGLEEIQTFFETFLPTVGEVRTSMVDFDAGSTLGFVRGRFFYAVPEGQRKRRARAARAGASGTIFTVFRREGEKWKIRLQLFMAEP